MSWPSRLTVLVFIALLAAPAIATVVSETAVRTGGSPSFQPLDERRQLAPFPKSPKTLAQAASWLGRLDLYLADHFALRRPLIELNNRTRYALYKATPDEGTGFGPTGRLFLYAPRGSAPYAAVYDSCGYGISDSEITSIAAGIETAITDAVKVHPRSWFVLIPSSPSVNRAELPGWLQRQCSGEPTGRRVADALKGTSASEHFYYAWDPVIEARSLPLGAFPPYSFHWEGDGPRLTALALAEVMKAPRADLPLTSRKTAIRSDIGSQMPGIDLPSYQSKPDLEAIGATWCIGRSCFDAAMQPLASRLRVATRLESPQAPQRKLLILSDSFGRRLVPWFAANYQEVRHYLLNYRQRLTEDQRDDFLRQIFDEYRPDDVIFVAHDGAFRNWWASGVDADILRPMLSLRSP
jgi:hypothetical protein